VTEDEDTAPERATWVSIASPDGGGTHMRITRRGDRWVVTDVYLHASEVTAADLQSVPIGQLDLSMNLTTTDLYDLQTLMKYGGHGAPTLNDDAGDVSTAVLRAQAEDAPPELRLIEPRAKDRPKLTRPAGRDPDAFYQQVARAYAEYASQTRAPAIEIAKEAGVPVGTARGWVREARRRGHLRPGRQGKVG
jgi:hypothetical protein